MTNRAKSALCGPAEPSALLPWLWLAMAERAESEETVVLIVAHSCRKMRCPAHFFKINTWCGPREKAGGAD